MKQREQQQPAQTFEQLCRAESEKYATRILERLRLHVDAATADKIIAAEKNPTAEMFEKLITDMQRQARRTIADALIAVARGVAMDANRIATDFGYRVDVNVVNVLQEAAAVAAAKGYQV